MTSFDPAIIRKAAAFVEKLDELADTFGVRLADDAPPIAFSLISSEATKPQFQAVPKSERDPFTPSDFQFGVAP